ncbi:MAG TPA: AbrB/MazE/SpoVT family DNA-binding domain-containing protein [Thermoanaerobaculia bacterium]|nr:AbrB/MazE/SpoVT family DNA-binding domain-containing protein [Thermoanaerobaculia bacterium]
MPKSKITSKHQTTVPKEVRDQLRVGPGDVLRWEIVGGIVRLTAGERAFLKRRGSIRVGPGSVLEDIAKARALRGTGLE